LCRLLRSHPANLKTFKLYGLILRLFVDISTNKPFEVELLSVSGTPSVNGNCPMKYAISISIVIVIVVSLAVYLIQEKRKVTLEHLKVDEVVETGLGFEKYDKVLVFGTYSSDRPSEVFDQFRPMLDYVGEQLSEVTGLRYAVTMKIFGTYEDGRNAIINGKIDFARVGPASYVMIEDQHPSVHLLGMELKGGERRFKGLIVVGEDSPIQSLSDLKGCRFGFGEPTSTIGRYLAQAELVQASIHASDLREFNYLGRHDLVFKSVLLGDCDAGALKESTFKKLNKNGALRSIHEFFNVTKPWIARSNLDQTLVTHLKNILQSIKPGGPLTALKATAITDASSAHFDATRRGMLESAKFGDKVK
jgi:phosphonate transport system substrate-binding protein